MPSLWEYDGAFNTGNMVRVLMHSIHNTHTMHEEICYA